MTTPVVCTAGQWTEIAPAGFESIAVQALDTGSTGLFITSAASQPSAGANLGFFLLTGTHETFFETSTSNALWGKPVGGVSYTVRVF